jgi:hypothetical protein
MERQLAERLAQESCRQLAYRLEIAPLTEDEKKSPFDVEKFAAFFESLNLSENPDYGLFLGPHKRPADFPKEFSQDYEKRDPSPIAMLEINPRGVIRTSKLLENIQRSNNRTNWDNFKEDFTELLRKLGWVDAFPSWTNYLNLISDNRVADILKKYSGSEQYYGFLRVDYRKIGSKKAEGGWYKKGEVWTRALPTIIIPGINEKDLKDLSNLEADIFGLPRD